jgi:FkbM family methyltransferase
VIRRMYQLAAAGCAEVVTRIPGCEGPFLRFGAHAWSRPWIGRFYQSAADRVAQRIRRAGSQFRRVTVGDTPLVLDVTEFTTRTLYFGHVEYEPKTAECLHDHLGPGGVFVDIGANHGYFSMLAGALVGPAGRVVSFEPNPEVFAQLKTHVRLNGFEDRVTLEQVALGDAPSDSAELFISQNRENSGLSSLTPARSTLDLGWLSPAHTIPVRVETFDRWFAQSGLTRVNLVKIDVEGAEGRVVAGMSDAIRSGRIGALLCETVPGGPADRALVQAGYTARLLEDMGPISNVLYSRR